MKVWRINTWIGGVVGTRNICIRDMALLTVQKPIAGSNPARSIASAKAYIEEAWYSKLAYHA